MANTTDKLHAVKDLKTKLFVVALGAAAAAGSVALPVGASILMPILVFLSVTACSALVVVWLRAEAALKLAKQAASSATSNYVLLANRLIKLEHQLRGPANPSRSAAPETAGTEGFAGGERARGTGLSGTRANAPEPRSTPERASGSAIEAEPSLLPGRKATEDELRRMRLVTQAFETNQIELHLQPIVALPQRKIRFYEALARLRMADGTLLGPSEFLPFIERVGRAPEFDRRILERAMAVARHLVARGSKAIVGVNLSSLSVCEPGFLWSLVGMVDASPETLGKIVLEFPKASWSRLDSDQRAALGALRERGVLMSLDGAEDLAFEAKSLADLGIRFMKLPAEMMIAAARREDERGIGSEPGVRDFATALRREGIMLVAEHVEHEEMVPALIELGVPMAQGFVFSAPRAVRAEVLGAPAQPQSSSADPGESLLRRAG